nr:nuclear transport factor 2 family protein [Solirubrobacterales bacterium]
MSVRTAREVLGDHLRMRREGDLERDLAENYHPEVIVLTAREAFRGRDGVRRSAHRLWRAVAEGGSYIYDSVLVEDRLGLLEWRARTDELLISTGVDA